LNEVSDAKG